MVYNLFWKGFWSCGKLEFDFKNEMLVRSNMIIYMWNNMVKD